LTTKLLTCCCYRRRTPTFTSRTAHPRAKDKAARTTHPKAARTRHPKAARTTHPKAARTAHPRTKDKAAKVAKTQSEELGEQGNARASPSLLTVRRTAPELLGFSRAVPPPNMDVCPDHEKTLSESNISKKYGLSCAAIFCLCSFL
jgi:hypothetical protein